MDNHCVICGAYLADTGRMICEKCEKPKNVKRYHIYYRKYNVFANAYIPYVKVVHTDDIYHEIGKMICKSMEKIESISYTEPKASQEECEKYWTENGYRKISDDLWICDKERSPKDGTEP